MSRAKLTQRGQVAIPKAMRVALHWEPGAELDIEPAGDGIVVRLSPQAWRLPTREELGRVSGCLKYSGPALSIEDMDRHSREAFGKDWQK